MLEILNLTNVISNLENLNSRRITHLGGFSAVFRRNVKIILQYKIQPFIGLISTLITFSLYFFISKLIPEQQVAFHDIIVSSTEFIIIGMLIVDLTTRTMKNSLGSFVAEMRQGTFISLVMQPFGLKRYVLAEILFENIYSILISLLYYVPVLLIFQLFQDYRLSLASVFSLLVVLAVIFIFFFSLTLVTATLSLLVKRSRELTLILVAILQLLSGALFPLSLFPHWLKLIALASPYTLAIDALRLCIFKKASIINPLIIQSVVAMLIAAAALFLLFQFIFGKVYRKLKTSGEIQNY